MYNKKEFKEIKNMVETICKSCDDFESNLKALEIYFTKINNPNSPRREEFNNTYNIVEIFNSKEKKGLTHHYKDGTMLMVDYYLYKKAPKGILVFLNQMKRLEKGWFQCGIGIFAKED